jgi:tryptophanyl-tRNA synthetase
MATEVILGEGRNFLTGDLLGWENKLDYADFDDFYADVKKLLENWAEISVKEISEIETEFKGCNYGTFKTKVADVVVAELEKIQSKYNEVINSKYLDDILDDGKEKMKEIFKTKYEDMKKKIGLSR